MKDGTQRFLYRQRKCLTLMGHSLDQNIKESRWKRIPWLFGTFVVISAQYPMIYYAIHHINNLEMATASMSIDFTNMLTSIKIVTFLVNKSLFLEIMNDLKKMWQNCDNYASKRIKAANVLADRMVHFYFISVSCTGMYFMTGPLVKIAWAKILNQPIVRELPMPMSAIFLFFPFFYVNDVWEPVEVSWCWILQGFTLSTSSYYSVAVAHFCSLFLVIQDIFHVVSIYKNYNICAKTRKRERRFFFNAELTPGYECAFIYTGFITFAVVMHATAIDGLFISFAINLRSHFRLLQHYIQMDAFNKTDAETNYDICLYIHHHIKLLAIADKICQTYKPIIFGQFLITSLQVCVIVYQLVTHMDNLMVLIVYIIFFMSIMIQLLIYCYGGEILKIESLMVATSVQLSNWHRLSPKYRRMLCFLIMRSQKEVIIRGGFYEASLANYLTILRAAMSYITLIQSIE